MHHGYGTRVRVHALSSPDLKHDNILFRPQELTSVISHALTENPSITYDCGTEANPSVIPVVSQVLPLSAQGSIHERNLDVVLADVGHCESASPALTDQG